MLVQVSVATSPQHWWQHAWRIIRQERLAVLGANEASGRGMAERRKLRLEHERLYTHQRVLFWRLALLLCGRLGTQQRALQKLEADLTDEEAALFRWWSWAKRRRAGASKVLFREPDSACWHCKCRIPTAATTPGSVMCMDRVAHCPARLPRPCTSDAANMVNAVS